MEMSSLRRRGDKACCRLSKTVGIAQSGESSMISREVNTNPGGNYRRIINMLRSTGYDEVICIEYLHIPSPDWPGLANVDVVTEIVKMRDRMREWLA